MIEFSGYLTGEAKQRFVQKSRAFGMKLCLTAAVLLFPLIVWLAFRLTNWVVIPVYIFTIALLAVMFRLFGRKIDMALVPKTIRIEEDILTCVADQYEESKMLSDVKCVYDRGAYYEIVFPFGKLSEKFICQKDLLSKGSLSEFEALFKDILVRKA